jgi:1-aminocyclopropane-1-carboxylate deaminase/D-cysteine desulfhydrase-like pyridoxal-dependent ACC family enzyme
MFVFFRLLLVICLIAPYSKSLPLFEAYPKLKEKIKHISLCALPTPIKEIHPFLAREFFGRKPPKIYLKNDGVTALNFGGNKVRKLEFLLADAQAKKASRIVAIGSAGSNFCCATAVHSAAIGIPCTCLYSPQLNTRYLQRNALMAAATGATLELFASKKERGDCLAKFCQENPMAYIIPGGGSNALGALGYVNAAFELKGQIAAGIMPCPDEIFVAFGSGGTAAGLMLGLKAAGLACHVTVVQVCEPATKSVFDDIQELFIATNDLLCASDASFPRHTLTREELAIDTHYYHGVYAKIEWQDADAIALLKMCDAIKTDGTYTSKALRAMTDYAVQHEDKTILFWNTFFSGNQDILTNINYKTVLPPAWHAYFDGTIPMQLYDQGV